MKVFQVTSVGLGRQLYLAETVDGALDEFRAHVARCDAMNKTETDESDKTVTSVKRLGPVLNYSK